MGEWIKCAVGDIVTLHYGKGLPASKRVRGNIPVYSSAGLTGYHDKALVDSEGLVIGRKGTIGKVYKSEKPFFAIDTAYYIKPNDKKYSLNFMFYFFQQLGLEDLNEDSAVPGLNRNTVYSQKISFPSLEEQKAIAEVLSSLDDKIDLFHRQNETLSALAETIFRQWFVEEGSENWQCVTLGDFVELHYGKGLKKSIRSGVGYPVIGSSGIIDYHSEFFVEGPGIVIGRKGTLGKTIYVPENFYPIDTTYYVKPKKNIGYSFIYYLLNSIDFKEMNSDSAVPGLNRDIGETGLSVYSWF